ARATPARKTTPDDVRTGRVARSGLRAERDRASITKTVSEPEHNSTEGRRMAGFVSASIRFCARHRAGIVLAAGTAGLGIFLHSQGAPLNNDIAPDGILSLELASSAKRVQAILDSWKGLRDTAVRQVRWDFPFIVFYALSLFRFGLWASRRAYEVDERFL